MKVNTALQQGGEERPCNLKLMAEVTKNYNSAAFVISCHEEMKFLLMNLVFCVCIRNPALLLCIFRKLEKRLYF